MSCGPNPQIGKNVHLSGGAGIGGVLEPLQANPTVIEDNCFIGARSEIVEGVIVEENSVISMGVFIGQSTKIYDRTTGEVTYAGGHEEIIILRAATGRCETIETQGAWLGAVPTLGRMLVDRTLRLERGDVMVLYTDGVTETPSATGERFGMDRLLAEVERRKDASARAIQEGVMEAVARFGVQEDDVTVVAIGRMVKLALAAADALAADGVAVEIVDPRTLVPFDAETVLASVAKTGRLVVVDEARECCSAASQIAALVAERGFDLLSSPIRRVTTANVAIPYAPNAEAHVLPDQARIEAAVREVIAPRDRAVS